MRVLLMEPSRLLARAVERGLKEEGFAVYLAAEGKQCGDFELQTAARRLVWEARQNMSLGLEEAIDEIENIVGCPDREELI